MSVYTLLYSSIRNINVYPDKKVWICIQELVCVQCTIDHSPY